jgi:hypothetical protein
MEKVLSRILFKLSVARTVKLDVTSCVTAAGVPVINPAVVIDKPDGRLPLNKVYVKEVAGSTAEADKEIDTEIKAGYEPNEPAVVFQIGCAI